MTRPMRTVVLVLLLAGTLLAGSNGFVVHAGSSSSATNWGWDQDWPFEPALPDHIWIDLGGGEEAMFLHFKQPLTEVDDPFDPAFLNENLMYIGYAQRGRFFAEEQPANAAFTHFHQYFADSVAEGHGGDPGAEGFWLVHVAVNEMEMPWGRVSPGVDFNFMPTPAPGTAVNGAAASATDFRWSQDWPFDPALPDHTWIDIGGGKALFLHYTAPVGEPDAQLMYVGIGTRGRFFAEDQPAGPGHTHFHQFVADSVAEGHGGAPGAEGYWLRHISVRNMEMPWGEVSPGIDFNFMPTPAPSSD